MFKTLIPYNEIKKLYRMGIAVNEELIGTQRILHNINRFGSIVILLDVTITAEIIELYDYKWMPVDDIVRATHRAL